MQLQRKNKAEQKTVFKAKYMSKSAKPFKRRTRGPLFVEAQHIEAILRCSIRKAYYVKKRIWTTENLPARTPITSLLFSRYTGISKDLIDRVLEQYPQNISLHSSAPTKARHITR